ncbi:MarR family transcriptional regulator [Glaciibacter flavus]|uniref:MarR family transcriptional regulator n=1 Tax=Orlajensenia flava TaxID=2565934 RepID=A0A4S4FPH0_9MICO|nr:MarR family transcriptional regulator [Glaciibacter flavus]THG32449.1 MarR family transcriptional regulator [Glaciibacter flavus]
MSDRALAVATWESLFRAQVAVMRTLATEFPTQEISFNEYDVMFNVSREPGRRLRLRELNKHVLLTQPSVSRLVDRLVALGFLEKIADPEDGRGAIVLLTDAGYTAYRRVAVQHAESIRRRVGSVLDSDEMTHLAQLCDKLQAAE